MSFNHIVKSFDDNGLSAVKRSAASLLAKDVEGQFSMKKSEEDNNIFRHIT